jgi:thiamine biosynthesis lipoprotein
VAGQRLLEGVLELNTTCLASSGDYRNFFLWDGELYSHEIDPRTGRPARAGVAAVSVLHGSSAMWADAYATGLMVMPPDQGWQLARQQGLEIMMILHTEGGYQRRMTPGFRLQALQN